MASSKAAAARHLIDAKHQVIIHAEAFGRGQDHAHGPPMLEGALENLKRLGHGEEYLAEKIFTADTNYHSDTNLRKCQELRLDAYILTSFSGDGTPATPRNGGTGPGGSGLPERIFITRRPPTSTCARRETDLGVR